MYMSLFSTENTQNILYLRRFLYREFDAYKIVGEILYRAFRRGQKNISDLNHQGTNAKNKEDGNHWKVLAIVSGLLPMLSLTMLLTVTVLQASQSDLTLNFSCLQNLLETVPSKKGPTELCSVYCFSSYEKAYGFLLFSACP